MASFSHLCTAQLRAHCSLSCSFPVLPAPGLLCFTEQEPLLEQDRHVMDTFVPHQPEALVTKYKLAYNEL